MLIQYTVAQKLSDKVQIMLVPSDGKFFFTNDVLRSAMGQNDPPAEARGEAMQENPPSLRANVRP
jgi:hypothetical protein